ncbi:MAG: hypothetical protein ACOY40_02740 [Bacillota bacterium]
MRKFSSNQLKSIFTITLTALIFVCGVFPGVAYAFDLKAGANDTLDLIKIFVMIAVLASAIWTFFRSQVAAAIVIIIVGAVLLAMTTPGLMESVGKGFLNLLGGGA